MQSHLLRQFNRNSRLSWARWAATWQKQFKNQPNTTFSASEQVLRPPGTSIVHFFSGGLKNSNYLPVSRVQVKRTTWPRRLPVWRETWRKNSGENYYNTTLRGANPSGTPATIFSHTHLPVGNEGATCSWRTNQQQLPFPRAFLMFVFCMCIKYNFIWRHSAKFMSSVSVHDVWKLIIRQKEGVNVKTCLCGESFFPCLNKRVQIVCRTKAHYWTTSSEPTSREEGGK